MYSGILATLCAIVFDLSAQADHLYHTNSVRMLNDVLHMELGHKTAVYLTVCWPPAEITRIYNQMPLPISLLRSPADLAQKAFVLNDATTLIVVDLDCPLTTSWISQVNDSYFKHPMRWLVLSANVESMNDSSLWNEVPVWMDSHVTLATWDGVSFQLKQGNYTMYYVSMPLICCDCDRCAVQSCFHDHLYVLFLFYISICIHFRIEFYNLMTILIC